jgi:hypothetical protein
VKLLSNISKQSQSKKKETTEEDYSASDFEDITVSSNPSMKDPPPPQRTYSPEKEVYS